MSRIVKLSQYAKERGICYMTAYRWHVAGQISGSFTTESGTHFVEMEPSKIDIPQKVLIYCRVSNQSRKKELEYQVDRCYAFCAAKGLQAERVYKEIASGMNENRKELWKMLDSEPTTIVVENKDRLTRFGFKYLENLLNRRGCTILVINPAVNDEQDLIKDMISVVTSFCCRLYGLRRTKNKMEKIRKVLSGEEE